MELQEEFLSMTIKGITRTCFGSVFNDDEEIHKMAHLYHKVCWYMLVFQNCLCTIFVTEFGKTCMVHTSNFECFDVHKNHSE